ncbi:MAG TPA: corrinoid protein [Ignavibacteriaceae bacterium]|nr:corrinoid protein [Ignavibacteriaceae bacterium]
MQEILNQISICIEFGKVNKDSKYPSSMIGLDGAVELTKTALKQNIPAEKILNEGMMPGMQRVGVKFRDGKIFLPEVLIAAKAMSGAMELLKPYFQSGEVKHKGKVIVGTVAGDLHDIGKNIVKMVLEGGGWQVIDLGVNVNAEKFVSAAKEYNVKIVGLSALLTTTMQNMATIISKLKEEVKDIFVIIGGAPVSQSFADSIKADKYFPDPQAMLDYLNQNFTD